MNSFQKQYEEMLRKESLTAGELIEILKHVDSNSIIKISDWTTHSMVKDATINNGTVFLYTFKI